VVAVHDRAAVDREQVTLAQLVAVRDAVDDRVVDREAEGGRERVGGEVRLVPGERRHRALPADGLLGHPVELLQGDPGAHRGAGGGDRLRDHPPGSADRLDLVA
jgi:hypothetical protein